MHVLKTIALGAASLSLLAAAATPVFAQDSDHHDDHRTVTRTVVRHHVKRVCTMRHHHRVCVTKRW